MPTSNPYTRSANVMVADSFGDSYRVVRTVYDHLAILNELYCNLGMFTEGVNQAVLKPELAADAGAGMVGSLDGRTVQEWLDDMGPFEEIVDESRIIGRSLFVDYAGEAMPDHITRLYSTGHTWVGIGAAEYCYDALVDADYVTAHPLTSFLVESGRGFRLDAERMYLEMAGGRSIISLLGTNDIDGTYAEVNTAALNELIALQSEEDSFREIRLGYGRYEVEAAPCAAVFAHDNACMRGLGMWASEIANIVENVESTALRFGSADNMVVEDIGFLCGGAYGVLDCFHVDARGWRFRRLRLSCYSYAQRGSFGLGSTNGMRWVLDNSVTGLHDLIGEEILFDNCARFGTEVTNHPTPADEIIRYSQHHYIRCKAVRTGWKNRQAGFGNGWPYSFSGKGSDCSVRYSRNEENVSCIVENVGCRNLQIVDLGVKVSGYNPLGTVVFTGLPSDLDTVTIGGKVYTFQTTLTDLDGNVQIGVTSAITAQNLKNAVNLGGTPGLDYALAMTPNPNAFASGASTTITVVGPSLALSEAATNVTVAISSVPFFSFSNIHPMPDCLVDGVHGYQDGGDSIVRQNYKEAAMLSADFGTSSFRNAPRMVLKNVKGLYNTDPSGYFFSWDPDGAAPVTGNTTSGSMIGCEIGAIDRIAVFINVGGEHLVHGNRFRNEATSAIGHTATTSSANTDAAGYAAGVSQVLLSATGAAGAILSGARVRFGTDTKEYIVLEKVTVGAGAILRFWPALLNPIVGAVAVTIKNSSLNFRGGNHWDCPNSLNRETGLPIVKSGNNTVEKFDHSQSGDCVTRKILALTVASGASFGSASHNFGVVPGNTYVLPYGAWGAADRIASVDDSNINSVTVTLQGNAGADRTVRVTVERPECYA